MVHWHRSLTEHKTAIIAEIHGKVWLQSNRPTRWADYTDGHQLSRHLYNHIGILGIDKLYLTIFYNETVYPTPPSVEAIYPSDKYCVVDWYRLGVLDWRPGL